MSPKRKQSESQRSYPEKINSPDNGVEDSKNREYQGGIYSDSSVVGASQDQAKSERP